MPAPRACPRAGHLTARRGVAEVVAVGLAAAPVELLALLRGRVVEEARPVLLARAGLHRQRADVHGARPQRRGGSRSCEQRRAHPRRTHLRLPFGERRRNAQKNAEKRWSDAMAASGALSLKAAWRCFGGVVSKVLCGDTALLPVLCSSGQWLPRCYCCCCAPKPVPSALSACAARRCSSRTGRVPRARK